MEELIIQRVNNFMGSLSMKTKAFSLSIGIPESTLKQQLNGKTGKGRGIQIAVITAILSTYPDLSAEWLLRGEGEMERQRTQFKPMNNKDLEELRKENAMLIETNRNLSCILAGVNIKEKTA